MNNRLLGIFLIFMTVVPATSQAVDQSTNPYQPLINLYQLAVKGDETARDEAFNGFKEVLKNDAKSPLATVYFGGTLALMGRDAWMPWNKMSHTERGLDTMARAITLLQAEDDLKLINGLPISVKVKSISAITFTQVPGFFNRFEQGYALLEELIQSNLLKSIPFARKAHIYYYAGEAAESDDQKQRAITHYQTVIDHLQAGEFVDKARQRLVELSETS